MSCASHAAMPPVHSGHPSAWALVQPPIKLEPVEDGSYLNGQAVSSYYSEGFHSSSPSSSRDSNAPSPHSMASSSQRSPLYDNMSPRGNSNPGMHPEYRNGRVPYGPLTPPGFDPRHNEAHNPAHVYGSSYSPRNIAMPVQASTPIAPVATPPKSPPRTPSSSDERKSVERYHDSGFNGTNSKPDDGHDGSSDDNLDDEPGLRVPAVNSHGKVKTFKCKQCTFVAVTKVEFWEHSKIHIKPEKMLKCKKCPFVTEFKHHLEYHVNNHLGAKPFRCSECKYTCVNKSMLNSHKKSHSNIYQYRCADCTYATKYCHSLKQHLRKYHHKPAMVLNPDGTPNPGPIIDVYGTRRGPRQKPKTVHQMQMNSQSNTSQSTHSLPPQSLPPHPLFPNHFAVNLPYLPPILAHQLLFPPNNNYNQNSPQTPRVPELHPNTQGRHSATPPSLLHQRLAYSENPENATTPPPANHTVNEPRTNSPVEATVSTTDALDLTNARTSESGTPPPTTEVSNVVTPTTALRNRRKGRAFKLQPAALRLQHEDENNRNMDISDSESDVSADTPVQNFMCQYCDITFRDLTMHTIHMGYHGYNDPFMCNKCGERSADRVSFYIHLGRAEHA